MKKIVFLSAFLMLFALPIASAAPSTYDFQGFTAQGLTTPQFATTFNFAVDDCQVLMSSTNTFTSSGSFDSTISWRSPDDNIIGTNTLTGLVNTSCRDYGQTALNSVPNNITTNYYESSITVTETADSGFVNTRTRFVCQSDQEFTIFTVGNLTDSRGFCIYPNRFATGANTDTWLGELSALYQRCGDMTPWITINPCIQASLGNPARTFQYIYPFNSSSGNLIYDITAPDVRATTTPAGLVLYNITILDTSSDTQTDIGSFSVTTAGAANSQVFQAASVSGSQSLTPNTQHLLIFSYENEGGAAGAGFDQVQPPIATLNISTFVGDFVCGEFTECINGSQSQVCVDQFGVLPDEIRTVNCFDVPFFINVLGFEEAIDFSPDDIHICQRSWDLFACPQILRTIPASFPVNWTVSGTKDSNDIFRDNYIEITSKGGATEGSRALRMWYVPPRLEEPVPDPDNTSLTVCGNLTTGKRPFSTTGFNESLFVSTNITFPAPNIQLRYDVKKCAEPAVQRDNSNDTWSFCDISGAVRKRCYGRDCETPPLGKYSITMFDANTFEEVFLPIEEEASLSWETKIINLANADLQVNHNYTLVLLAHPGNLFEADSDCVYFDNVQATLTETEQPCETECLNLDRVVSRLQGVVCFSSLIVNHPLCAPDPTTALAFENFQDVCIGTTMHTFDNQTGFWGELPNNDICISQINETAEQVGITQPLESAEEWIDWILFLASPLFIFFFISIAISGAVGALVKAWEAFGITFAFMLFIGMLITVPGGTAPVIPTWVGVAMIAVISLMIAYTIRKMSVSGGG